MRFSFFILVLVFGVLPVLAQEEAAPQPETSVQLGFNLTRGNEDTSLLELGAETKRPYGDHTVKAAAAYAYGQTQAEEEDITTRDTANANLRYDYVYRDPYYVYTEAEALRDEVAEIDYRVIVGPGAGARLVRNEKVELNLETGVVWVADQVDGEHQEEVAVRAGQSFAWKLREGATLTQSVDYLRKFNDEEEEIITARATVESALAGNLHLRLDLRNRYESEPAEGKDSNNLTFTAGISVKL